MAGYLTTHVLDTARGVPAAGIRVALYRLDGAGQRVFIRAMETDADGRTDGPILPREEFETGIYELVFQAGPYLAAHAPAPAAGTGEGGPRFLDDIPIRFGMDAPAHYHVPLLLAPHGYTTYRGS